MGVCDAYVGGRQPISSLHEPSVTVILFYMLFFFYRVVLLKVPVVSVSVPRRTAKLVFWEQCFAAFAITCHDKHRDVPIRTTRCTSFVLILQNVVAMRALPCHTPLLPWTSNWVYCNLPHYTLVAPHKPIKQPVIYNNLLCLSISSLDCSHGLFRFKCLNLNKLRLTLSSLAFPSIQLTHP